jgi:hypothetical protein
MKKPIKKENLEKLVRVRLTPKDHAIIKAKCEKEMIPMSTYILLKTLGILK